MLLSEVAVLKILYLICLLCSCAFALYYCKNTEKPKCMNKVQNCDIVVFILSMNLTLRTHVLLVLTDLLAAILGKARASRGGHERLQKVSLHEPVCANAHYCDQKEGLLGFTQS